MEIKQKITVNKNDSIVIKSKDDAVKEFKATLKWQTAVDLDLYVMYRTKAGADQPKKGIFSKMFSPADRSEGTVFYGRKGNTNSAPFIRLDGDAGVGDTGGFNEENIRFYDMDYIDSAIIVANIFGKSTNFAQYNGSVIVHGNGNEFTVPLSEKAKGSWCVVAKIDNRDGNTKLINVNKTMKLKPMLKNFI